MYKHTTIFIFLIISLLSIPSLKAQIKSIDTLFIKTDLLLKQKEYRDYIHEIHSIKKISSQKKDTQNHIKAYQKIIRFYHIYEPNNDSIQWYYTKSLEIAKHYKSQTGRNEFSILWADYLIDKGMYAKSLSLFQELEPTIQQNNYDYSSRFYNVYAKLYFHLKDFDLSFQKLKISAKASEKLGDLKSQSASYNNLGILYKSVRQMDSSLLYHSKSLQINLKLKDTLAIAKSYNNIGDTYEDLMYDMENSELYYELAYRINKKNPTKSLLTNYANILIQKKKFKEAEKMLISVKEEAINIEQVKEAIGRLILLKKSQKKYKEALAYYDEYTDVSKSLLDEEKVAEIERLKVAYEAEKKENEIFALKTQNEIQKTRIEQNRFIIFISGVLLLLIFVITALILRYRIIKSKIGTLQLEQQLLRSQMNPHFIFNALSNIQTSILKKENLKSAGYLAKFSKLLRNILESSTQSAVPFSNEIEALKGYLELQKIRFESQLNYTICIDDTIEEDFINIPPMLFQPLIENAIEHGISSKKEGHINIDFKLFEKHIECIITDNGVGYSETLNKKKSTKKSLSSQIIKNRLSIFSKKVGHPLLFNIQDTTDEAQNITGTQVKIDIPIITE